MSKAFPPLLRSVSDSDNESSLDVSFLYCKSGSEGVASHSLRDGGVPLLA